MRASFLLCPVVFCVGFTGAFAQTPESRQSQPVTQQQQQISPKSIQPEPLAKPIDPKNPNVGKLPDEEEADPDDSKAADNTKTNQKKGDQLGGDAAVASSAAAQDYTGPSVLSRGFNVAHPSLSNEDRFRPFIGVNAIYDSGIAGPYNGPNGRILNTSASGVDFNFGLTGRHVRSKDLFEISYRGHYYQYNQNSQYNGQDQALALSYTRYLNAHTAVGFRETAGLYSNTYSVLNSTPIDEIGLGSTTLPVNPGTEAFDDRTYYTSTEGTFVWKKTARLSFNFGGSYFTVNRRSFSLSNVRGYQAQSNVNYRITRRSTLGTYYSYTTYNYPRSFGDSNIHTVGALYSYSFSKSFVLRVRVGGARVETLGLGVVTLDPAVAAILGYSTGIIKAYSVSYVPDFSGDISKRIHHSTFGLNYTEGVTPGNGLYLTSRSESQSVYLNYDGIQRYAFTFAVGRDMLGNIASTLVPVGSYSNYYVRATLAHTLPKNVQAVFGFDYRNYGFAQTGYGRNQFRITAGLSFAPKEGPLKLW